MSLYGLFPGVFILVNVVDLVLSTHVYLVNFSNLYLSGLLPIGEGRYTLYLKPKGVCLGRWEIILGFVIAEVK
jgi:hypothetical protein